MASTKKKTSTKKATKKKAPTRKRPTRRSVAKPAAAEPAGVESSADVMELLRDAEQTIRTADLSTYRGRIGVKRLGDRLRKALAL